MTCTTLLSATLRRLTLGLTLTLATWWVGSGCATQATGPASTAAASVEALQPSRSTGQPAASAPDSGAQAGVLPAVAAPVDPVRPEVSVNLDDAAAQTDLWARVRRGFRMPDLDNELVRERERWYASRPDYVDRMTTRGSRYLFHIVEELELRGMPTELALLPFIESAFNPQAMSSAKASGMWQFMPATGRDFDLKQNIFRDDRRDVLASTRAALDYLQRLHGQFGDWHLALAAYNWGEGSVQRAIARNEKAGLPTDYLSLKMPDETRNYVPKLQAVKNIVAAPGAFELTLPVLANHPYFLGVPIQRDIDVDLAARLAGMSLDEFQTLNPQMNKPVILAAGTPQVLLPYDNASAFVRKLSEHRAPLASWTAWVAPKTMRPADAARQVGMSEVQLRDVNRIPPKMLVKAGSTLLVPRSEQRHSDVAEHVADNATMELAPDVPPLRRVVLKAGKADTVASIARRYRVGAAQVAQWNAVGTGTRFKPGAAVVVYQATRPAASTRVATARAKKPAAVAVGARSKSVRVVAQTRASKIAALSTRKSVRLAAQ
ncbi:MAG: transglycosylase SLT domain-containing protein [Burkholderiaceae bacterium]|nr:transglycosylase SLT domain-containing protein [Burkholderiaceae bacterium]